MPRRKTKTRKPRKPNPAKERAADLVRTIAAMTDEQREALAARLPTVVNPDGHALSFRNTALLIEQSGREDLTIVAGFRQWKQHGRHVRKGEHAAGYIYVPMMLKKNGGAVEIDENGEEKKDLRFRLAAVWDVSQTDETTADDPADDAGEQLEPATVAGDAGEPAALAVSYGSTVVGTVPGPNWADVDVAGAIERRRGKGPDPAKLRGFADGLQRNIDHKRNPDRLTNTRKRAQQADQAHREAAHLEKCQAALRTIADHAEAGTLPDGLAGLRTKKSVLELLGWQGQDDPRRAAVLDLVAGSVTPAERAEAERREQLEQLRRADMDLVGRKIPGFFATPGPVAAQLIHAAEIAPGSTVLEPSAGKGDLAAAIVDAGGELTAVEISHDLANVCALRVGECIVGDCMNGAIPPAARFDRVVMNPPFEKGADAEHVRAMFDRLEPGGRLVAVMGEGTFCRSDRRAAGFREWLERVEGYSATLPPGSFKPATGAAARLVVIDAPEADTPEPTPTTAAASVAAEIPVSLFS